MDTSNTITATVLSVAEDKFKDKQTGNETTMYRVYIAGADGRVGYLYSSKPRMAGNVIQLALAERDGKLRLRIL